MLGNDPSGNETSDQELVHAMGPHSVTNRITRAIKAAQAAFPAAATRAKSRTSQNLVNAIQNIEGWLTQERFCEYREALLDLIEIASADAAIADELYDSFYRVIPFGTGGRRAKVGIGPNRMNPYIAAMTAQGNAEFIIAEQARKGTPVTDGDLFLSAWDVREFHIYFAETPELERYRKVIQLKCPTLSRVSSRDLSEIVALVYAGNGIRFVHPESMRATPWLSFFISAWHRIVADHPFTGKADLLNRCRRVIGGIVLSSSHNPYDNNGTKFYEMSGAQTPPHIVDLLQRIGDAVQHINFFGGDLYHRLGRKAALEAARNSGMVVILDEENIEKVDRFYIHNSIDEIKGLYTSDQWKMLTTAAEHMDSRESPIGQFSVSFNALNGTGATGILKILEHVGFKVLRSPADTPSWAFSEGYGNIPNPEAEKTFNTGIQIGIRRTLKHLFEGDLRRLTSIVNFVDEDDKSVPANPFSTIHSADELIQTFGTATGKSIRGIELALTVGDDATISRLKHHILANNICLLTDPDADRTGLGMQTFSLSENRDRVLLRWISANDNDEPGVILFRYRLEKLLEMAERGELVRYIEDRRREDGRPAEPGQFHQLVVVNTVVSNPLERAIAERISRRIGEVTGGRVSIKMITHHVGFKFTGEIIDNISRGNTGLPFDGITGELMTKAGIDGKAAFFVMSAEEGEGSLIGNRGSIDKDSGVTGLALAFLAVEQQRRGMTLHEYLMETYDLYGYSRVCLEPMVMTGEYGMTMINDNIMGYLREVLLPSVHGGHRPEWQMPDGQGSIILTGGLDHLDLLEKGDEKPDSYTAMKRALPDHVEQWPSAIRESLNIIEFTGELAGEQSRPAEHRTKIVIVMRPSGTEPKHKNMVMVLAPPRNLAGESLKEYTRNVDILSRRVLDASLIACYDASRAEYESKVAEVPGTFTFTELSPADRLQLLRIFPIVVSAETKLAVYLPLRVFIQNQAALLAKLRGREFLDAYESVRRKMWAATPDGSTSGYLTYFNKTNGIEFIEESVRMNLVRQLDLLYPGDPRTTEVYVQTLLWFGPERGRITFGDLFPCGVGKPRKTGDNKETGRGISAEIEKAMASLFESHSPVSG